MNRQGSNKGIVSERGYGRQWIARIVVAYGESLKEDVFKDHVGKLSVKSIARTAKERRPGALGYAEAMMLAYNTKSKYRLSLRALYGEKVSALPEEEE